MCRAHVQPQIQLTAKYDHATAQYPRAPSTYPAHTLRNQFDKVVHELAPKNKELLKIREDLQKKIDDWHIANKGHEINLEDYKKFLKKIGYLKEVLSLIHI